MEIFYAKSNSLNGPVTNREHLTRVAELAGTFGQEIGRELEASAAGREVKVSLRIKTKGGKYDHSKTSADGLSEFGRCKVVATLQEAGGKLGPV